MLELIERYREGKLTLEEKLHFEERMQQDAAFAATVHQHLQFLDDLHQLGKRKRLTAKFNKFHDEMLHEAQTALAPTAAQPAANAKKIDFSQLRKKYLPIMGMAASVSLVTMFCTLYAVQYMNEVEKNQQSNYRRLKREVETLKIKQNNLEKKEQAATQETEKQTTPINKFGGTGFAISSDGLVATSYHLVEQKPDSVVIESSHIDEFRYKAVVVYFDKEKDLAILKINDQRFNGFGALPYTLKSKEADLGEEIFTLAHPKEDVVYGEGVVSSQSGYEGETNPKNYYQVSIPVNPGYSGSPTFDQQGNILGLITSKQADLEGVGFALKSEKLLEALGQLPDSVPMKKTTQNRLARLNRTQQLKKIKNFIFQVKVY